MDTSKEFQLMLDKAIESEPLAFRGFDRTKNVQDQLQEMVRINLETNIYTLHTFFNEFIERYYGHNIYPCDIFTSMGQLWLAFVLKENHNKVWNGEDWIAQK